MVQRSMIRIDPVGPISNYRAGIARVHFEWMVPIREALFSVSTEGISAASTERCASSIGLAITLWLLNEAREPTPR